MEETNTNYLMEQPHHSEYPLLSLIFSVIGFYSWFISTFDMQGLDNALLLPLAHSITIVSGAVAICLGSISLKEKYHKWRKKK